MIAIESSLPFSVFRKQSSSDLRRKKRKEAENKAHFNTTTKKAPDKTWIDGWVDKTHAEEMTVIK